MHERDEIVEQDAMMDDAHERDEIVEQDAMMDDAHERRWRRWISGRCYCAYPILVSDPTRRPMYCIRCGGFIPPSASDAETDAAATNAALVDSIERENRILRVALIIMIAIAAVAVYLYDKAVTAAISGGTP
jgi:hypothetical protein